MLKKFITFFISIFLVGGTLLSCSSNNGNTSETIPSTNDLTSESSSSEEVPAYFLVNFDSNGGTNIPQLRVRKNDLINRPTDPIKVPYKLSNWTYQGEVWNFEKDVVTCDMTLEAVWEKNIYDQDVTFKDKNNINKDIILKEDGTAISVNLELTSSLVPNISHAIQEGDIKITTSDASILKVDNLTLTPQGKVGSATINVTWLDVITDSITFNVRRYKEEQFIKIEDLESKVNQGLEENKSYYTVGYFSGKIGLPFYYDSGCSYDSIVLNSGEASAIFHVEYDNAYFKEFNLKYENEIVLEFNFNAKTKSFTAIKYRDLYEEEKNIATKPIILDSVDKLSDKYRSFITIKDITFKSIGYEAGEGIYEISGMLNNRYMSIELVEYNEFMAVINKLNKLLQVGDQFDATILAKKDQKGYISGIIYINMFVRNDDCIKSKKEIPSIYVDEKDQRVILYGSHNLNATYQVWTDVDTDLSYSSSNEDVIAISADGTMKGLKVGTSNITVTYNKDTSIKKTFEVKCEMPIIKLQTSNDKYKEATYVGEVDGYKNSLQYHVVTSIQYSGYINVFGEINDLKKPVFEDCELLKAGFVTEYQGFLETHAQRKVEFYIKIFEDKSVKIWGKILYDEQVENTVTISTGLEEKDKYDYYAWVWHYGEDGHFVKIDDNNQFKMNDYMTHFLVVNVNKGQDISWDNAQYKTSDFLYVSEEHKQKVVLYYKLHY